MFPYKQQRKIDSSARKPNYPMETITLLQKREETPDKNQRLTIMYKKVNHALKIPSQT